MAKRENVKQFLEETIESLGNGKNIEEKVVIYNIKEGLRLAQTLIDREWDELD